MKEERSKFADKRMLSCDVTDALIQDESASSRQVNNGSKSRGENLTKYHRSGFIP